MRVRPSIAVLWLTAAAVAAGGCGDDDGGSAEPVAATTDAQPADVQPAFIDRQPLTSGKLYTTTLFKPAIRVRVPDGAWSSEVGDTPEHFALAAVDPPGAIDQAILGVHRINHVYDPRRGGVIPGDQVPLHGSFAKWLQDHPRLRVSAPKQVQLLGLPGVQLDITTRSSPPRTPRDCGKIGDDCVPLFYDGFDSVLYSREWKGRFTVLELADGGELVIEQAVDPARTFQAGLELLRPMVARLTLAAG